MATFQKPENALKRAEELIEVGKKQDALDTLHAAIQHRRFRNLWTTTIERIMVRHLELCVELKKMRTAREGLYQYRTMCQAANIGSLELVVQRFRKAAEEKVSEAKKAKDLQMAELADLDEMEAPQTILLRAIQAQDTRQQSQDRDTHAHFRFLWDTYKVVLDVLKSNVRLEEVYHETARHAFDFCRQNTRPQEFKRLCETLRKNYLELHKHPGGKVPQHQVNPLNPDTVMRTLETRCRQLQIATELDLWRESYVTATEIFELMSKTRPKPHLRSMYYEYLGQIFWKSDNHLFHAFACLKNLMFVKAAKQNLLKEELQLLASKAVLATLCVPFQKNSDIHATLELTTEGASSPYEKAKKHATLFNVQSVPTRDSISAQLVEKGLLALSVEPCKRLFALIESDFTPLSLCQDAKPFLDEIATDEVCEGKLTNYITPLKQIIFFRLMKQLSEVYANMTIENFEHAASIVPFSIAEKWMANAARQHGINIQINYSHKAIVFGAPRKVDMKSMRQPLIEIGYKLQQAMQRVAPEEQHKKEKLEKQQLSQNIVRRIEEESKLIRQRKEEIERRKEESERRKEIQDREAMAERARQEAREAEAERVRQEEERKRREVEREEQNRKNAQMVICKEKLEQLKKTAVDINKASLKVAGKKITEIVADDLEKIGFDQIEKAREAQVQRERQEKIRQRKLESKRVDHLARALREEEQEYLDDWADDIEEQDQRFLEEAEEKNAEVQRKKHEEGLKEKERLIVYQKAKDKWARAKLEARDEEAREKMKERERRLMQKVVDNKIQRARERMEKEKEEQRRLREEEEKEQAEKRKREEEEEERLEEERKAEERKAREEAAKREAEEQERLRLQRAQQKALELGPEPEAGPEVVQLMLRLPEGGRLMRRFVRAASLRQVLDWIESEPSTHVRPEAFRVVQKWPGHCRELGPAEAEQQLSSLGFARQEALFLQHLQEEAAAPPTGDAAEDAPEQQEAKGGVQRAVPALAAPGAGSAWSEAEERAHEALDRRLAGDRGTPTATARNEPELAEVRGQELVGVFERLVALGMRPPEAAIAAKKYAAQLKELGEMGFENWLEAVPLLEKYGGRLLRVANLLSEAAAEAGGSEGAQPEGPRPSGAAPAQAAVAPAPAPAPSEAPTPQAPAAHEEKLRELAGMGFTDEARNRALLQKYAGRLERVVEALVSG
mmetsp:Transcript_114923/g.371421  ORF Transcript_114923/g.371421 Transcript_114923/m.371421 type:complete len:1190 (-) Transcript_114923:112-3681(-)